MKFSTTYYRYLYIPNYLKVDIFKYKDKIIVVFGLEYFLKLNNSKYDIGHRKIYILYHALISMVIGRPIKQTPLAAIFNPIGSVVLNLFAITAHHMKLVILRHTSSATNHYFPLCIFSCLLQSCDTPRRSSRHITVCHGTLVENHYRYLSNCRQTTDSSGSC